MTKLSEKQLFIVKATLGTTLAINAGNYLALNTDSSYYSTFYGELNYWLFPMLCLIIIQWILFSNYFLKNWIVFGFIGCALAILPLVIDYIRESNNQPYSLLIKLLLLFLKGILATIPQGILLRNRNGFFWVLANGFGWAISFLYSQTYIHLIEPIPSLSIIQTLIRETYYFPLGILLGLSLYNIINSKTNSVTFSEDVKV